LNATKCLNKKKIHNASSLRELVTFFKSFWNLCTQSRRPSFNLNFMWWATEDMSIWSLFVCDECPRIGSWFTSKFVQCYYIHGFLNFVNFWFFICLPRFFRWAKLLFQFIFGIWTHHLNVIALENVVNFVGNATVKRNWNSFSLL
jgi:hypothetical protein